jgi:hypothetical protein
LIFTLFFKSPQKAAEPIIYFATSQDVINISFDYLHLMTRKEIDQKASDPENGRILWEKSEHLLNKLRIELNIS